MNIRSGYQHGFAAGEENLNLALASELLRHDPVFHRIPLSEVPGIVNGAIRHGAETAGRTLRRFGAREPIRIANLMDVRIIFDITSSQSRPLNVLSRYSENPPTIVIYESALRNCREKVATWEIRSRVLLSELTNICVSHELYHHLERASMNFIDLTYRVPVLNLGFIRIEKSVRTLSEISAHSFARTLLNLPILPCCLDPRIFAAAG
ncbi:MAG: hypothetical protein AB1742_05670 [bacterium]